MRRLSSAARQRVTEPWEECVLYVYDDKRPKEHGRYVEWDGGAVRGTLTIGFGHTDAAGGLRIRQGLRITRAQADELLSQDLAPCELAVNRLLKVEVTQHQFDMLVDTYFNCPKGAVAAIKLFNAGQGSRVPAKLLQYTYSKGEHMEGLVHRRNAEIAWGNTPDEAEPPPAPNPDIVFSPKAERDPPPKKMRQSKTGTAAVSIGASGIAYLVNKANELLDQARVLQGKVADLGLGDAVGTLAHKPEILLGVAVVGLAVFIWFDRRHKLVNDHV